jgi:hypothetical protein
VSHNCEHCNRASARFKIVVHNEERVVTPQSIDSTQHRVGSYALSWQRDTCRRRSFIRGVPCVFHNTRKCVMARTERSVRVGGAFLCWPVIATFVPALFGRFCMPYAMRMHLKSLNDSQSTVPAAWSTPRIDHLASVRRVEFALHLVHILHHRLPLRKAPSRAFIRTF